MQYKVPSNTRIGHSHLKVSDLNKSLSFYRDILGFEVTQWYGESAVFLSAGGYHHHLGLNTWYSKGAAAAPTHSCGLFHTAILYSTSKELAEALKQIIDAGYPLTGASDHGVSEAIYLDDPDGNGVELYWDRPKNEWPRDVSGNLRMVSDALDLEGLLKEITSPSSSPASS
jgi:catechol 2,3-dioxygenase